MANISNKSLAILIDATKNLASALSQILSEIKVEDEEWVPLNKAITLTNKNASQLYYLSRIGKLKTKRISERVSLYFYEDLLAIAGQDK